MKAKFEESHTNNVSFWRYDCDSFLPSFLIQFVSHAYFEINIYWINNRRKIMKLFSLSFKGSDTSGIILLKQYGKLILGETTITYIQLVKLLQHFTKGSITPAPHTYTFPCPSQPSSPFLSQLSFWNKTYDPSAPVHKLLALHSMVPAWWLLPSHLTTTHQHPLFSLSHRGKGLLPASVLDPELSCFWAFTHVGSSPWNSLFLFLPVGFLLILKALWCRFHYEAIFNLLSQHWLIPPLSSLDLYSDTWCVPYHDLHISPLT